jgi:WD repeat-containing protein 61
MSSFIRVHGDGGSRSVVWTERGVVTAGVVDANIVLTAVDGGGPPKVAKTVPKGHIGGYVHVAADHGLNRVVTVAPDGDVQTWDLDAAPEKDSRSLVGSDEGRAGLVRVAHAGADDAHAVAHSPLLPQYATGGVAGRVTLWDGASGDRLGSVALAGSSPVLALAYAPDGGRLAAACHDGSVHVIDTEGAAAGGAGAGAASSSLAVLARIAAHALPVRGVAFSHDGTQLYTACDDGRVGAWDASGASAAGSSAAVAFLSGHAHWALGVAASPDKHLVASASADRTVRLWDVRTRECVHVYAGHTDKVWAVTFDPAGGRLASVSEAGTLGVFSVTAVV